MPVANLARAYALLAGALDFLSGLGFLFFPQRILSLLLIAPCGQEASTYLRFVGTFVASLGASYLWAGLRGNSMLAALFELTLPVRAATGMFAATAVFLGWLSPNWGLVTATDLAFCIFQVCLLKKFSCDGLTPAPSAH